MDAAAPSGQNDTACGAGRRGDLTGKPLSDKMVGHVFRIEDGLIRRFDIRIVSGDRDSD
jgi:hypothetical protein